MTTITKNKIDIQQDVTNNIIELLDQVDLNDYQPPFANLAAKGIPENPITQNRYQGINILALWFNQKARALPSNKWASFKQWKQIGACVKKGEKGARVIFYKTLNAERENKKGELEEFKIPMLKHYTVFNATQVEGFEDQDSVKIPTQDLVRKNRLIEQFCQNTKANIKHEGGSAFYDPLADAITMPNTRLFLDNNHASATEHYYATLFHELTHWTGAAKRLDRKDDPNKKRLENYAYEELIAELGAAFLCAQHDQKQAHPHNHALYIKSWLQALRNDKTLIFKAAAKAEKATQYLNALQQPPTAQLLNQ